MSLKTNQESREFLSGSRVDDVRLQAQDRANRNRTSEGDTVERKEAKGPAGEEHRVGVCELVRQAHEVATENLRVNAVARNMISICCLCKPRRDLLPLLREHHTGLLEPSVTHGHTLVTREAQVDSLRLRGRLKVELVHGLRLDRGRRNLGKRLAGNSGTAVLVS